MHRRVWVAAGIVLAVAVVALSGAAAYAYVSDRGQADVIAKGVTVAGIEVGGLHAAQAKALLLEALEPRLRRPVKLVRSEHTFTVHPSGAGLRFDVAGMVNAAVTASRAGGFWHRVKRELRGTRLDVAIPLRARLSREHVDLVVRHVARAIDRTAKNAAVSPKPLALGLRIVPSRWGVAVDRPKLAGALTDALLSLDGSSELPIPVRPVRPRVSLLSLTRHYGTYVLVSRETFTLRLYKRLKLVKTYRIAVGRAGLETPAGEYTINDKQVNPSWHVPLSSWAGDLAGRVIPPGPDDPIKARWMGFYDGAGIHGTDEIWSIGTAASHGCIRMTIPDVEDLYPRVPLDTPIYVD
jgi:L,D-transpeptidase catalytic domain/Putative peptidoglycan binding domain